MKDDRTRLEYAPRSSVRWFQKRPFQRALLIMACVALAPVVFLFVLNAWDWGATQMSTAKNRRIISAASEYIAPANQIVFEMDAGVVKSIRSAEPWVRWFPPDRSFPTIFLHKLSDPAGPTGSSEPLVELQLETQLRGDTYDGRTILDRPLLCFTGAQVANVSSTGGWKSGLPGVLVILPQPKDHIVIYAGQPDPKNASRFTFRVDYNGVRHEVVGTLARGGLTLIPDHGTVDAPYAWRNAAFWIPAGATDEQASVSRTVAQSSGIRGPTTWPMTPFGRAFNDMISAPSNVLSVEQP